MRMRLFSFGIVVAFEAKSCLALMQKHRIRSAAITTTTTTTTTSTAAAATAASKVTSFRQDWSTYEFTMTINGKGVTSEFKDEVICPATGKPFAYYPIADKTHLESAIQGSLEAFQQWKKTTYKERRMVMEKMAKVLDYNKDELGMLLSLENGKPLSEGIKEAGPRTGASLIGFSQMDIPIEVLVDTTDQCVEIHRQPYGIVGCIIPWNFPLHSLFQKIAPAIYAGNVCIVKPSSSTPLSTLRAFELLRNEDALGPPGLIQILSGPTSLGQEIVKHPKIPKISFTGSTKAGINVSKNAVTTLKRLTLELGGNDAAIVLDDIIKDNNIPDVANGLCKAAFANSGQVCHALKRLYVHESIHDDLCNALIMECKKYIVGHPIDDGDDVTHGPLTTKQQYEYIIELVDQAVTNGATIIFGGNNDNNNNNNNIPTCNLPQHNNNDNDNDNDCSSNGGGGYYYSPTLITNVKEGIHRIVMEEQFGPILPILKFKTIEEVIERVNSSEMGLTSSIWTSNDQLGYDLALQLETGTGYINHMSSSHTTTSSILYPSQGYKMTGMGCNRGLLGLLEYTQPQTINHRKN